jgi:peptidoglycan/LPS O-acetylase OafA/YrhL
MRPALKVGVHSVEPVPVASQRYVLELDGIRTLAVGFVVAAHYGLGFIVPGGFGVTLFFFLSGYLITTLLCAEYAANSAIDIPRFYVRRWLRLTPPLIINILIAATFYQYSRHAVDGTPMPLDTTLAALFYYTNYYDLYCNLDPQKVIPFGVFWSLAVEEHFYLVWPLILYLNIKNPKNLFFIVFGLCLLILGWRIIITYRLDFPTDYTYMATDCRLDSILFGSLLRISFQCDWGAAVVHLLRARLTKIVAFIAFLGTFLIRNEGLRETVRYSVQGLVLMPFFTAALCDNPRGLLRRLLAHPAMVLLGRLSYSIYLFHLLLRTPGEYYFGSPTNIASILSGLAFTFAVSLAVLVFVERPIARLRHHLQATKATGRSGPAIGPAPVSSIPTHARDP